MTKLSRPVCALLFLFPWLTVADAQWFVDIDNASGTEDGASWETAFTTIQPALDAAAAESGEVWVAQGVYGEQRVSLLHGDTGSLVIPAGVTLLGGFSGSEEESEERDPVLNVTTISGANSLEGGPAAHVVAMETDSAIDGFTVSGGVADSGNLGEIAAGIYAPDGPVSIRRMLLINNTSFRSPSAIEMVGGELLDSTILLNEVTLAGGGIRVSARDALVQNCIFRNGNNGGLSARGSTEVRDCLFEGNRADSFVAGLSIRENAVVDGCTFIDNVGEDAGAVLAGSQFSFAGGEIRNCVFINNTSTGNGGAVSHRRSSTSMDNCLFMNNTAAGDGGAVYHRDSRSNLVNCVFVGNSAAGNGGASSSSGSRTAGDIVMEFSDTIPRFFNCTFYGNTAGGSGSAIYAVGSDVVIQNGILWNNCPDPIAGRASSFFTYFVTNAIIEGGFEPLGTSTINPIATDIIDLAPQFVDVANGDFRLSATSPAIDAGMESFVVTDFDGVERPQGRGWDLGAFEFIQGEADPGTDEESLCPAVEEGEGESEGMNEGSTEGMTEGATEGSTEGEPEGTNEGASEGMPEGNGDGNGEGATEGSTEGMNEGAGEGNTEGSGEGMAEGSSEGSTEGGNEGSGEGDSEGSAEGMAEGASEGASEGDTEGNGDTHGGCPWNNDAAFAPPTDSARQNAGTILVLPLTSFVLLKRGRSGVSRSDPEPVIASEA